MPVRHGDQIHEPIHSHRHLPKLINSVGPLLSHGLCKISPSPVKKPKLSQASALSYVDVFPVGKKDNGDEKTSVKIGDSVPIFQVQPPFLPTAA